jgi:sugar/nucleoside kinase (ribokinase family)
MGASAPTWEDGQGPADAVVAGHISLDVFPRLTGPLSLEPGRLVVVGPAVMSTGGAVANVGVALHRLGVRVGLNAKVGDDLFGSAVLDRLADHDRRLAEQIAVSQGEATSYTIVINPPGVDRSFLHCPGTNETFAAADVQYARLAGARVFHFGYPPLMPRMYADRGRELRSMFARVQGAGVATALDLCVPDPSTDAGRLDWREVLDEVLPYVDIFAPSIEEMLFMFDRPAYERLRDGAALASVVRYATLAELGGLLTGMGATVVAIKLGDQGLYLRTTPATERVSEFCFRLALADDAWRDRELLSPCFQPRRISGTTGSGDATIAGLLAALLRGSGPEQAATCATAVGAFSVEEVDPTSGIPRWERVLERLSGGWPRLPVEIRFPAGLAVGRDASGTITIVS